MEAATAGALPPGTKVDVEVVAPAGCGVARSRLQRTPDGDVEVPRACNDRTAITDALERTDPNLVLVAPGVWEHGEFSPYPNNVYWVTPDDAYGSLWFIGEMGGAVDLAARSGAVVGLVNLPATPATVPSSEGADRRTSEINTTLGYVAGAPDRSPWLRLVDLRNGADPVAAIRQLVLESVTPPTTP